MPSQPKPVLCTDCGWADLRTPHSAVHDAAQASTARGETNNERPAMNLSPDTINLCLELLAGVSVPVTVPDAEAKMSALVAARQELLGALDAGSQRLERVV